MRPRSRFPSFACALVIGLAAAATSAKAQIGPAPQAAPRGKPDQKPKPPRDKYGSPLDTLMSTHLWTDVPQTQDFVRATHPDPKSLDYTPLTGKDPDRPKPRDATNIEALRAELEQDNARNTVKAKGLADPPAERRSRKAAKTPTPKTAAAKIGASKAAANARSRASTD